MTKKYNQQSKPSLPTLRWKHAAARFGPVLASSTFSLYLLWLCCVAAFLECCSLLSFEIQQCCSFKRTGNNSNNGNSKTTTIKYSILQGNVKSEPSSLFNHGGQNGFRDTRGTAAVVASPDAKSTSTSFRLNTKIISRNPFSMDAVRSATLSPSALSL